MMISLYDAGRLHFVGCVASIIGNRATYPRRDTPDLMCGHVNIPFLLYVGLVNPDGGS
jgi:hypothetical protein